MALGPQPDEDWPNVERRTGDSEDTHWRRRETDVDVPPSTREVEKALSHHEAEAREWRARHDTRLAEVEEQTDANRLLLDGLIASVNSIKGTLEVVQEVCLKIDGQTSPTPRWEKFLTLLVTLIIASLPVIAAYFAFKGQLAQVTQGPSK
jgi:hypothetical protein